MRLTTFSDYSLRLLIYLGVHREGLATVGAVAAAYGISENHLVKIAHHLGRHGYIDTVRGKGGGMRLARSPRDINLGQLVRATEDRVLVECFDGATSQCRIQPACVLRGVLGDALEAFYSVLDAHTLQDLLAPGRKLERVLVLKPPKPRAVAVRN